MIRTVGAQEDFTSYAKLLNDSFATIAAEFGLTKENSPTNNAFITAEQLRRQFTEKAVEFFCYEHPGKPTTRFVGIE